MNNSEHSNHQKMKKLYLILAMCMATSALAQNSFPTSNAIWNVRVIEENIFGYEQPPPMPFWENVLYCMEGDTIIDDIRYSNLYDLNYLDNQDTIFVAEHVEKYCFLGGIREENKKVWFKMGSQEYLLYDFGASIGDTVWHNLAYDNASVWYLPYYEPSYSIIQGVQIIDGIKHLYAFTNLDNFNEWIEGIGSPNGLFGHLPMDKCLCYEYFGYNLGCFKHNGVVKYRSCECSNCFYCPLRLPLIVHIECNGDWSASDTICFNYQSEPIQVNLVAWMPPVPFYGYPPFTYHWTTNSDIYVIEDNTIYNPAFSFLGEVTVYLKVTDACSCIPVYKTLTLKMLPLGINEILNSNISIYPNPTTGELRITNYELRMGDVEIFDVLGRKQKAEGRKQNDEILIDVPHFSPGIYFVKITTEEGIFIEKIIKQ